MDAEIGTKSDSVKNGPSVSDTDIVLLKEKVKLDMLEKSKKDESDVKSITNGNGHNHEADADDNDEKLEGIADGTATKELPVPVELSKKEENGGGGNVDGANQSIIIDEEEQSEDEPSDAEDVSGSVTHNEMEEDDDIMEVVQEDPLSVKPNKGDEEIDAVKGKTSAAPFLNSSLLLRNSSLTVSSVKTSNNSGALKQKLSNASSKSSADGGKRSNVVTIDDFKTLHKLAHQSRQKQQKQNEDARKKFSDIAKQKALAQKMNNLGSNSSVTITPSKHMMGSVSSGNLPSLTNSTHSGSLSTHQLKDQLTANRISSRSNTPTPTENSNIPSIDKPIFSDPNLCDDAHVVEAPSFIVPYVYERPPSESFESFSKQVFKLYKEKKSSSESSKECELSSDKSKKKDEDDDGMNNKDVDECEKIEGVVEDDDVIPLVDDSEIESLKKPRSDNYFESTLGKFIMDLGMNLVQESVQTDLLRQQVRKSQKDKSASVMHHIVSLKRNLEQGREHNEPFHFKDIKCKFCSFRTESDLVMQNHLETPHMKNFAYRCNFCSFETKVPHDILSHTLKSHGVYSRLERAPAIHQCQYCLFEDNQKGKVSRHLRGCEKRFIASRNMVPTTDWDPPAKIAKTSQPLAQLAAASQQHSQNTAGGGGMGSAMNNSSGGVRRSFPHSSPTTLTNQQQQQLLFQQMQMVANRQKQIGGGGGASQKQNILSAASLNSSNPLAAAVAAVNMQQQQQQQQLASRVANMISNASSSLKLQSQGAASNSNKGGGKHFNSPSALAADALRRGMLSSSSGLNSKSNELARLIANSTKAKQQANILSSNNHKGGSTNSAILSNLNSNSSVTIQSVNTKKGVNFHSNSSGSPNNSRNHNQSSSGGASGSSTSKPSISITPLPNSGGSTSSSRTAGVNQFNQQQTKNGYVVCEVCEGYVKDLEQLRNHMLFMHKVKIHPKMIYNRPPLNCQKCQYRFFTDQGLERHLLGAHGLVTASMQEMANNGKDAGRCPVCGKVFQWKLLQHVTQAHEVTLKPAHLSYKCTVCTATFGQYKLFENHVYQAHSGGGGSSKRNAPSSSISATQSSNSSLAKIAKTSSTINKKNVEKNKSSVNGGVEKGKEEEEDEVIELDCESSSSDNNSHKDNVTQKDNVDMVEKIEKSNNSLQNEKSLDDDEATKSTSDGDVEINNDKEKEIEMKDD